MWTQTVHTGLLKGYKVSRAYALFLNKSLFNKKVGKCHPAIRRTSGGEVHLTHHLQDGRNRESRKGEDGLENALQGGEGPETVQGSSRSPIKDDPLRQRQEETTLRMQMRPSGRGRPGQGDGLVFLCGRDQHRGDKWREVMSTGTHWNPHVKRRLCEAEAIGASAHAKSSLLCSEAAIGSLSEKGLPSGGKA